MRLSDSLAKLPEGLIQELNHMKEEGLPGDPGFGFSAPCGHVAMWPCAVVPFLEMDVPGCSLAVWQFRGMKASRND